MSSPSQVCWVWPRFTTTTRSLTTAPWWWAPPLGTQDRWKPWQAAICSPSPPGCSQSSARTTAPSQRRSMWRKVPVSDSQTALLPNTAVVMSYKNSFTPNPPQVCHHIIKKSLLAWELLFKWPSQNDPLTIEMLNKYVFMYNKYTLYLHFILFTLHKSMFLTWSSCDTNTVSS